MAKRKKNPIIHLTIEFGSTMSEYDVKQRSGLIYITSDYNETTLFPGQFREILKKLHFAEYRVTEIMESLES